MKPAPPGPLASYSTCDQAKTASATCVELPNSDTFAPGTRGQPEHGDQILPTSLKSACPFSDARLMLRSMMSLGTLFCRARVSRSLSREFEVASGPPARTACTRQAPDARLGSS